MTEEDRILRKIETDPSIKQTIDDPMPPFKSVEQRLLDLTDRRLHPFYKRYMSLPKTPQPPLTDLGKYPAETYYCHSGDVPPEEMPPHLRLNRELLDKKNMFADVKKADIVPKQMLVRMVEMEKNRKPTLDRTKNNNKKKWTNKEH